MTPIQLQDAINVQPAVPGDDGRQNPRQTHPRFSIILNYLESLGLTALPNPILAVFTLFALYAIFPNFLSNTAATQVQSPEDIARHLFESTRLPIPASHYANHGDQGTQYTPRFPLGSSLVPFRPNSTGRMMWGIDPTPFCEPNYEVLEKTDLNTGDYVQHLQETRKIMALTFGKRESSANGEMRAFFEIFHHMMAIASKDVPNIQDLPPSEQLMAFERVWLLYRTGYQVTSGRKNYPSYPSWEELAGAQAAQEGQKRRSWSSYFISKSDPAADSETTEQVETEPEEPAARPQMKIWPFGTTPSN